jgi:hypothetical protein
MGKHQNVHSGPQEANHIPSKNAAKNAQRRALTIDLQTGLRLAERAIITTAYHTVRASARPTKPRAFESTRNATKGTVILQQKTVGAPTAGAWCRWNKPIYKGMLIPLHREVLELLMGWYWKDAIENTEGLRELHLPVFTEYRRGDEVYRVHNNFRQGGPWQDWCYIKWDDGVDSVTNQPKTVLGIAQLLVFVRAPDDKLYAVVHPCLPHKKEPHGICGTLWPMEWQHRSDRPQLYLVPVDSLERHALMIPYNNTEDLWLEVWEQDTWADCFYKIP